MASHGCQHSQIPVTKTLLRDSHECVQRIRLVLRFLLGVIHSHSEVVTVEPEYLYLDKYMLHALHEYNKEVIMTEKHNKLKNTNIYIIPALYLADSTFI